MINRRQLEFERWRVRRRRYRYTYTYRDLGPLPGTYWAGPNYAQRLRAMSRLLRELHVAAGSPPATFMSESIGAVQPYVSNLLNGRRLPPLNVVRELGALLAELAGADPEVIDRALRAMYTAPPPSSE